MADCTLSKQVKEVTDDWEVDTSVASRIGPDDAETLVKLRGLMDKRNKELISLKQAVKDVEATKGSIGPVQYEQDLMSAKFNLKVEFEEPLYNTEIVEPIYIKKGGNILRKGKSNYVKWADDIEEYTGTGYLELADARKGRLEAKISDFLNDQPENFTGFVYRGSRVNPKQLKDIKELLKTGNLISNSVPISTTQEFNVALGFVRGNRDNNTKDMMVYIKGKGHSIARYSGIPKEEEVLMREGKTFQVLSTKESDLQYHILLEEVSQDVVDILPKELKKNIGKGLLSIAGLVLGSQSDLRLD